MIHLVILIKICVWFKSIKTSASFLQSFFVKMSVILILKQSTVRDGLMISGTCKFFQNLGVTSMKALLL